jgi:uncharacterized integral membrane protein (TIGR00697 family)
MAKINKFDFLVGLYVFCVLVAELMGGKTFVLWNNGFTLNASVGIFVIPVVYLVNDIITEVYGAKRARSLVWTGLIMIALLILFSFLAIGLPPSLRFIGTEKAYDTIFAVSIRISIASLTAFAAGDFLDVYIFNGMRKKMGKKGLWLRTNLANFISEFFDTAIFISLAFYALEKPFMDNVPFLFSLILPYWALKCSMSVIETPFVYMGVKWLKKGEKSTE